MVNYVYLLGPAGCGKSTLASALADVLASQEKRCFVVNLDPGAEWLPYTPEIDIRTRISLREVMEEYKLGPNGALVVSVDLMVNRIPELEARITAQKPDYVLVDTPGQMELFAFRETGARVVRGLGGNALILFLIDSFFVKQASDFVSMLVLSTSVYTRFALPQLNVLTKVDSLEPEFLRRVEDWTSDHELLSDDLELESYEFKRGATMDLLSAIGGVGLVGEVHPVSALRNEGLVELYGAVQRAFGTETELDLGREENP